MSTSLLRATAVLGFTIFLYGCSDATNPTGPGDPTNPGNDDPTVQFDSDAPPGDSARSFLNDRRFTVLNLEVDYMKGYEPTAEALDSLQTTLETHLNKSTIHISDPTQIPAEDEGPYSGDRIRNLEEEHRDHYTRAESDTIHAYFLVLDGKFTDENVVGIAYHNTSMAFFGKTIEGITNEPTEPSREKVEASVFRHEFGHNLGLVDNGIPMQQEHQDDPNGPHCTEDQCVMDHALETTDYFSNLFDGTVPTFGQFCTEDMAAQDGE